MLHFTGDRKPQSMHSQPPPGPLFSTFIKYSSSSTNNEAVNKETPIKHTIGSIKNATIKTLFQRLTYLLLLLSRQVTGLVGPLDNGSCPSVVDD